jgi:predicted metal-dependent hydrolase
VSRDVLRAEVEAWAKGGGVTPREVHIRPMARKWGSCSTTGRVTFNAQLLSQPGAGRLSVALTAGG